MSRWLTPLSRADRLASCPIPDQPFSSRLAPAPSSHPRMRAFARLLETIGSVQSFDYPYALEGRRRPDPLPKLIAAHRAALARLRAKHEGPIALAGKSMGGRVGCHVALADPVQAVICFGYPLCGAGDRSRLRDQVLMELKAPILFVQGRATPFVRSTFSSVRKRMQAPRRSTSSRRRSLLIVSKTALKALGSIEDEVDDSMPTAIDAF